METNCSTLRKEELIFRVRPLTTLILLLGCCLSAYSQVIKTYRVSDVDPQCAFYTNNGYPTEGGHLDITSVTTYTAFPRNAGYALKVVGTTGTFKEYANGTATLDVVYNLADKTTGALSAENWTMHIDLVGRTTTAPPHFPMGGACGNAAGTGFVYYNVSQGTVTSNIAGHGPYIVQNKDQSSLAPTDPPGSQYTAYFQMGNGASLRHPTAFGLGGWWDVIRVNNPDGAYPFGVGDSYLELEEIPSCTNPTVSINNTNPSICPGGNSTLSVSGCTGGTVAWNDGATGVTRVVSPSITTTYSATCTIGDCNGSASTSVTVSPAPAPTVNSPSICAGQSAVLTVSNCSGTVNWGGGITGATRTVNPTTTTTYSATCTVGACSGSTISTVTVTPAPAPTVNSPSICAGQSAVLTVSNCSGTVVWNDGSTGLTKTVNPTTTTTYSATCTVGACSGSTTSTVTVNPLPTLSLAASATNVTVGTPVSLSANGCSGNVAWSSGQTGSVITVTPMNATQTYSATCTTPAGCSATAAITVTTQPAASLVVTSATICAGQSATLVASGCTGNVTWNTGATGATLVTPTLTSTTSYTATCTTGTGSTTTAVGTVTVSPLPTLSLAASATNVTVGTPVSLTANGCSGNLAWSSGQTGSVITVTPMNATQTYSATCTTPAGCSATAAITVTTQPAATCVLSVTVTPGSCVSATNTYSVTATIQLANGPTGILTISTGAFSQTIATTSSATTYTAVLNGLHSDGVTHSVLISLAGCTSVTSTYTAPASCTITTCPPPVHVCKGSGYVYQLNTTPDLGTYQWYRNGIAISGATSSTYNATQAGSYSVVVNGNVAGTCPDNSCCPAIIVEDSIPDYQAQTQTATCQPQSNSVNSDGRILITNWTANSSDTTTYYYEINLGATYDASQRIAGGSTIRVPSNGVLVTNIPNPVSVTGQAYTIRISSSAGCFKDKLVILPQTTCSCPPAQCLPFVIRRIR